MTDAELLAWAQSNVIDARTAAARCKLSPATVRGACNRDEIAGAWKPSNESRVWLMTYGAVLAWRGRTRAYNRKDA